MTIKLAYIYSQSVVDIFSFAQLCRVCVMFYAILQIQSFLYAVGMSKMMFVTVLMIATWYKIRGEGREGGEGCFVRGLPPWIPKRGTREWIRRTKISALSPVYTSAVHGGSQTAMNRVWAMADRPWTQCKYALNTLWRRPQHGLTWQ